MTLNLETNQPARPAEPSMQPRSRIWKAAAGIFLIGGAALLLRATYHAPKATTTAPPAPIVAAVKVTRETLAQELTVQAELRPFQEVEVHAKVSGFLQRINVDVGDHVKAGDTLAVLEIPELEADLARSSALESRSAEDVKRLEAAYSEAHSAWSRLQAVNKAQPRLIADQELEIARGRDAQAASALAAARLQVEVARAETTKLRTTARYASISAPFSGVITKRYADPGALIQSAVSSSTQSLPLVRLSQADKLRVVFPVSMSFVSAIRHGQEVELNIPIISRKVKGTVARTSGKIESATRTMDVELDIPNSDFSLIPGMYATVAVRLGQHERALALPIQAVSRGKNPTVYLVNRQNRIEERSLKLGIETPERVEILGGVQENDTVILGSRAQVTPGERVEPKLVEAD